MLCCVRATIHLRTASARRIRPTQEVEHDAVERAGLDHVGEAWGVGEQRHLCPGDPGLELLIVRYHQRWRGHAAHEERGSHHLLEAGVHGRLTVAAREIGGSLGIDVLRVDGAQMAPV
ncbi:MAG TPA: hypothetical protein VGP82_05515, partial [Ktedonobacterales bacterium]|nr:hypothetical protein [Ktedonobacterales bacterium]